MLISSPWLTNFTVVDKKIQNSVSVLGTLLIGKVLIGPVAREI